MKRLGNPAYRRLGVQGLPWGLGLARSTNYLNKVLRPNPVVGYDPSSLIQFLPQSEPGGAVSYDRSGEGNNGAYTAVTLGQPGVPGIGMTSALYDGATSYNHFHSAGYAADFNELTGTVIQWLKAEAAMWVDGLWRDSLMIRADGNNRIFIVNTAVNNRMRGYYVAGGVAAFADWFGDGRTDWFTATITWNKPLDELKFYIDGIQSGATINGLGVWAGPLDANYQIIGAGSLAPLEVWQGNINPCLTYSSVLSQPEIAYLSAP